MKTNLHNDINNYINDFLANNPLTDIKSNIHALVIGIFNKLDLVTREEFEVQKQVLKQAIDKIEELERKIK